MELVYCFLERKKRIRAYTLKVPAIVGLFARDVRKNKKKPPPFQLILKLRTIFYICILKLNICCTIGRYFKKLHFKSLNIMWKIFSYDAHVQPVVETQRLSPSLQPISKPWQEFEVSGLMQDAVIGPGGAYLHANEATQPCCLWSRAWWGEPGIHSRSSEL